MLLSTYSPVLESLTTRDKVEFCLARVTLDLGPGNIRSISENIRKDLENFRALSDKPSSPLTRGKYMRVLLNGKINKIRSSEPETAVANVTEHLMTETSVTPNWK